MTPRQARVALGSFLLLAIGVTVNALYRQSPIERPADKPAPAAPRSEPQQQRQSGTPKPSKPAKSAEAPAAEPAEEPSKTARHVKVRMVRVAAIGEAPAEEPDRETVRAVQAELNRQGYGPLAADGAMRPEVRAAIMAFEHDRRQALTGEASQTLLKELLFGAPAAPGGQAAPTEVRSPEAQSLVAQVQRLLAERGYRPGAADGRLSAETVSAIRTFETDQGLVPKGRISAVVLERLQSSGMAGGGRHKD